MKTISFFATVSVFLFLIHPLLFAEESLTATLDRSEITLGETATLILSVKAEEGKEIPLPTHPSVPGLFIFYRETRQVLSPQGGKISPATEFVYTLFPETEGMKMIPPFSVHVKDRLLLTEPLSLRVSSSVSSALQKKAMTGTRQESFPGSPSFSDRESPSPKAFVRPVPDKSRPFLHEAVKVSLWAYATVPFQYEGLKGEPARESWIQLKGVTPSLSKEDTEVRDGETYKGRIVEEQIWFPQQTGHQVLDLGEMSLSLKVDAKDLFDRSFRDELPAGSFGSRAESATLRVEPLPFDVRPLPEENKPEDFSGAVGHFVVSASIDKTELEVGQSATFTFQIRGEGNLQQVKNPSFEKFSFATSFNPRISEKVKNEGSSWVVEKTFEVILITNQEGKHSLEEIPFSYFNPKFQSYRRTKTAPISLVIHERAKAPSPTVTEKGKEEPELLGKDIYYLKKELSPFRLPRDPLLKRPLFWGIQVIPLLILGLAFLRSSYQRYLDRNVLLIRRRRALQTAQAHLTKAHHHLVQGRVQDFAREAQEAILGYLSDKTGFAKGTLTIDHIEVLIKTGGGDESVQTNVRKCLEALQALQFASAPHLEVDLKESHELSKGVLRQLEKTNLPVTHPES